MISTIKSVIEENKSSTIEAGTEKAAYNLKMGSGIVFLSLLVTAFSSIGFIMMGISFAPIFGSMFFSLMFYLLASTLVILFTSHNKDNLVVGSIGLCTLGVLHGFLLSGFLVSFSLGAIALAAIITMVLVACMSIYSLNRDIDVDAFHVPMLFALIVIVIGLILNIFIASAILGAILSVAIILLMMLFVMVDIQEAKKSPHATPVSFALGMYLSLINIFINVLSLIGQD